MTIILHLALLVTIGAEVQGPISLQSLKQVAKEVEAKASAEEIETLRTLLMTRSNWHPNAPQLLQNVLSRPSGMHGRALAAASCSASKDKETCTKTADPKTSCSACKWISGFCQPSSCSNYENQAACCANAGNVKTGCFWNSHAKGSGNTTGGCVELGDCGDMASGKCGSSFGMSATTCPEAQSVCKGITGCQWNSCGGCQKTGMTCQCDGDGMTSCTSGGSDGGMAAMMAMATGNTGCGITDCALCLKKDESGTMDMTAGKTSCDTYATRATSLCSAKCSKVVHTPAEAKCLAKNSDLCGQTVAECKVNAPPKSCVPTTSSAEAPCKEQCTAFDAKCESSGTNSSCKVATQASTSAPLSSVGVAWMVVMVVMATR